MVTYECTNLTDILGTETGGPSKSLVDQINSMTMINDTTGSQFLCPRDVMSAKFILEKCRCGVKRMYLTFQTFSTLWFPLLISLGLYCLCDAILAQWKHFDKDKNQTRWPCAYRLAENIVKHSSDPKEESSPEEPTPEDASSENIVKPTPEEASSDLPVDELQSTSGTTSEQTPSNSPSAEEQPPFEEVPLSE